ncbi:MAG: aminoacyl-tRNA hydrolase [Epsilonproteobacteria bacterium]|nr:MAG: aminoacyl-tRNA hydrolase [Campylobacterota bacterium]RLA63759.1 MAG: aminoacyl-tRNA hydrolase [Campylobacterota bacterium]
MTALKLPTGEFTFSYSKSSGPGGQKVNKTNTKVTLRWNIVASEFLRAGVKERFLKKYRVLEDGNLVIVSQRFRSQERNISDCLEKLSEMIESVRVAPKKRRPTKPTRGSVEKRLKAKKGKSDIKKMRQKFKEH